MSSVWYLLRGAAESGKEGPNVRVEGASSGYAVDCHLGRKESEGISVVRQDFIGLDLICMI